MYINVIPNWIQNLFKRYTWKIEVAENKPKIFLSFDDGPHPQITPWVLAELEKYNAKATFFCIGKNVVEYPEVYEQILAQGHAVGNHSHNHLNGRKTKDNVYIADIAQAEKFINSKLFRPPYGSIKKSQAKSLIEKGFEIVLWTLIPGDWDQTISPEKCLEKIVFNLEPGNIIVLHDSEKAKINLEYILPRLLLFCKEKGWELCSIPYKNETLV